MRKPQEDGYTLGQIAKDLGVSKRLVRTHIVDRTNREAPTGWKALGPDENRGRIRDDLIWEHNTESALIELASAGLVEMSDLLWLLGIVGVMAPRSVWMLVGMHAGAFPEELEGALDDPSWWEWFDRDCDGP